MLKFDQFVEISKTAAEVHKLNSPSADHCTEAIDEIHSTNQAPAPVLERMYWEIMVKFKCYILK